MKRSSDLPNIQDLIEITRPVDDSGWLALDGFYRWEQPTPPEEDRNDISRREFWFIRNSYLVHQKDCDELFDWATEQDFMGRWMPEGCDFHSAHLGELYWSPAYAYETDPFEGSVGWQGGDPDSRIPIPIHPLVDTYVQEGKGFDCSMDDGVSIAVPTHLVVEQMGLDWRGIEGRYFDQSGKLVAFDPSVAENGPKTLLTLKDAFLSFLQENEYCVLWTILGEKQLIGGGLNHDNWKGKLAISGAYRWADHELKGNITPHFQSPSSRK